MAKHRAARHVDSSPGNSPYARHVGRVGALAVALGVGIAVATTPGIAWADDTSPPSDSSADSTSSSPANGASTPGTESDPSASPANGNAGVARDVQAVNSTEASHSTTVTVGTSPTVTYSNSGGAHSSQATSNVDHDDSESVEPPTTPIDDSVQPAATPPVDHPTPDDPPGTTVALTTPAAELDNGSSSSTSEAASPSVRSVALPATQGVSAPPSDDSTAITGAYAYARTLNPATTADVSSANSSAPITLPPPAVTLPLPPSPLEALIALPGNLIRLATELIASALAPLLGVGPTTPADTPVLWAVMAFVRRQFFNSGPTLTPSGQVADPTTGQLYGSVGGQDADGDPMTVSLLQGPAHGRIALDAVGNYVYTPNAGYVGTDSFTVAVSDLTTTPHVHSFLGLFDPNGGHLTVATIGLTAIAVASGNRPPTFGDPPLTGSLDQATGVITGRLNATDPEGHSVTYGVAQPLDDIYATLALDTVTGEFTFTPTALARYRSAINAEARTISFTVTASDGVNTTGFDVPAPVLPLHPDDDGTLDLADLDTLAELGAVMVSENDNGQISAIIGNFTGKKVTNGGEALAALNRIATLLGAADGFAGFVDADTTEATAESGGVSETFYRLVQILNGTPVLGSDVVLTTVADGTVTGVFSGIDPSIYAVNTTPSADFDQATEAVTTAARLLLGSFDPALDEPDQTPFLDSLTFDAHLVIYALDPDVDPTLAWLVDVFTTITPNAAGVDDLETETDTAPSDTGLPLVSTRYYIYANGGHAGALLAQHEGESYGWSGGTLTAQGLPHGDTPQTYTVKYQQDGVFLARLRDQGRNITIYNGVVKTSHGVEYGETSDNNIVGRGLFGNWDQSAISAMANMEKVYDYYKTTLGWDYLKANPGGVKVGIVDKIKGAAQFNPFFPNFIFGTDSEAALDAVGHEFTHAAIESILRSSKQSSFTGKQGDALNEAYGDIIGNLIERKDDAGEWLVAEDAAGDPWRDMKNPSRSGVLDSGPAKVGDSDPNADGHTNATIFDRAAYLMIEDPGKGRTAGVSKETWAQIFYNSMKRLPVNATFQNARNAVISAASVQGLNAAQQQAIVDAFDAVGISETPRVKIILRWGKNVADLDSHLTGPTSKAGTPGFHVYFGERNYFQDGSYEGTTAGTRLSANLDYDDTDFEGPETTTIRNLVAGDYYFYVNDYTNGGSTSSAALSHSAASVTVLNRGQTTGGTVFRVNGSSPGTTWTVFKLTIPSNGSQPIITPINTYGYAEPYYNL